MSDMLAPFVPGLLRAAQTSSSWARDGTFVLADVSGFTRLSEQLAELGRAGAEELTNILNGTFEELLRVARDEGGDLVKFGGDALFLFFDGEGHAQRACRAAHGMRAELKQRGAVVTGRGRVVLRISMGVHSGPFLFALAGTHQQELFVAGEHATTVTTMEATADAGEILLSPAAAALLPPGWTGAPKGEGVLLRRVAGTSPAPPPAGRDFGDYALTPLVPHAVRHRILAGDHGAEHRRVTVAFVHVGGLDALARDAGPEEVAARLGAFADVALAQADRHEVCVLASDVAGHGVKLILTAGAPDAVEDGEGRMLAVGRGLLDADVGLPVRIGVNTGHVFAGEVGADWRRVYTVMGDAVNLAARLMAKATPGELVASGATVERSTTPFETTALEPFLVKGKRVPQLAFSVGRRIEGRGRSVAGASQFVGRVEELAWLSAALARAGVGHGSCATIIGEPGIGKSRLVHELVHVAGGTRVVGVTCEPFALDRPYFVARLVLRTALGIGLDVDPAAAGRLLLDWLAANTPDWRDYAPLLAAAVDAEVPSTGVVDDLAAVYRSGVLREAAAAVLAAAFTEPLLLVLDDAMWMDEASELVLARALQGVRSRPWLVCLTSREGSSGLTGRVKAEAEVIELTPLDDAAAEALAAVLTDDAAISQHELDVLCQHARGNPLYLLELARARREMGSLDAIPETLEDLMAARIDRLTPADRRLLRYAAVLGDRFSPALFDQTLGQVVGTPARWHRLVDFVVADQGDLRFTHELARRVAYESLPFSLRRELHGHIARALVPDGEPDDVRLSLLALHFDRSGDHLAAWTYNRMAGQRAWDTYATVEATAFFDRAIHNARANATVPAAELAAAAEALADVALLAGRFDLAGEGLRLARRLRSTNPLSQARLCRKEATLSEKLGRHRAAVTWCRRGLAAAATLPEHPDVAGERGRLAMACASALIWQQRYRPCERWCRRALPDAEQAGDRATEAHAYYLLDWALSELGRGEAIEYRNLAAPIYEELGDYPGLASVLNNRGVDALSAGQWDEACRWFEESSAARRRAGDIVGMAQCLHNLAEVKAEQGQFETAEAALREARRIWRASGYTMGVAAASNTLGRTLARQGHVVDGVALLRDAQQRFEALKHAPFLAETEARLAEALVFGGRWEEAAVVLDHLGTQATAGGPQVAALALRMQAEVARSSGDMERAERLLDDARRTADKGGVVWESALAARQRARLPGTGVEERANLEAEADVVLASMGIDAARVLPPLHPAGATG